MKVYTATGYDDNTEFPFGVYFNTQNGELDAAPWVTTDREALERHVNNLREIYPETTYTIHEYEFNEISAT